MGLTESNQNKTSFWGPSKSKSTPLFADGRGYDGRPRQAATLPARPITNVSSPVDREDITVNMYTRPPDRFRHRDRSLQREHCSSRETRSSRPIAAPSVNYKNRQSDPLIELSTGPLQLVSYSKGHNAERCDNQALNFTPHSSPLRVSRHYLNATSNQNGNIVGLVKKDSRSRSRNRRRDSSSCSRRGCNGEEVISIEKETQTTSEVPLSIFKEPSENTSSPPIQIYATHFQNNSEHDQQNHISMSTRRQIPVNISCSVPTTPSEIISDPYVGLHYGNSLCSKDSSNRDSTHLSKALPSWRPVYSEACLFIPQDRNLPYSQRPCPISPGSKRSQITIKVDNNKNDKCYNFETINDSKKTVELCSNVWFESSPDKVKKRNVENIGRNLNNEAVSAKSKFYNLGYNSRRQRGNYSPAQEYALNEKLDTTNKQKYIKHNDERGDCRHSNKGVKSKKLTNASNASTHTFINRSISLLDNLKLSYTETDNEHSVERNYSSQSMFEQCSEDAQNESERNEIFDNDHETIKKRPTSMFSGKSVFPFRAESNVEIDTNECILSEDTKNSTSHIFMPNDNVTMNCNLDNDDKIYDKKASRDTGNDVTVNVGDGDAKNFANQLPDSNSCDANTLFLKDSNRRTTLPFRSQSIPQNEIWWNWFADDDEEMLRRKTIHSVDIGMFPVLRLPKLESQPRLVDVLRRESSKDQPEGRENSASEATKLIPSEDPLENEMCSDVKYSPLDENILYITEDTPDDTVSSSAAAVSGRDVLKSCLEHSLKLNEKYLHNEPKIVVNNIRDTHTNGGESNTEAISIECTTQTHTSNFDALRPSLLNENNGLKINSDRRHSNVKSQTLPSRINFGTASKKLREFFSLKLKVPPKNDNSDCNLTCHEQCQNVVSLDCKTTSSENEFEVEEDFPFEDAPDDSSLLHTDEEELVEEVVEEIQTEEEGKLKKEEFKEEEEKHEDEKSEKEIITEQESSTLRKHEVSTLRRTVRRIQSQAVDSTKIEDWVQKCPSNNVGLQIAKESDGGYRGCLRIHLNLNRPINIVAGTRPPSIYDIMQEDRTLEKTLTSFYMPRDAVKAIHITSTTTTREVIVALLRKFKVVDNPQKFALYERTFDTGQSSRAKLRRLSDSECPLVLAIAWNAQGISNKRLVMQENDTADIQWEAFSLPELDNFLRILDREEGEYKNEIRYKYTLLRNRIQSRLAKVSPVVT